MTTNLNELNNKKSSWKLILKNILTIILVAVAIGVEWFSQSLFGEESIFSKDISQNDFINAAFKMIPAVIRTGQIIFIALGVNLIVKWLLKKLFAKNRRNKTIASLLCNFIKWVIALVTVFVILGVWGVDTETLLASAGILTLVIGLGAQSLVADIVAGLFIVFEQEYQVGDIVVIDGWRGTVIEVGIRSTRIEDAGGNIKIVNNSAITSVINQTQRLSVATCTVGIEYGESLERVENIINDNLETIKKNIPAITDGPYYKGVSELGPSSVNLFFIAKCDENDIFQVKRDLNREIKLIFDKNGINIPFAQIVVNQPSAKTQSSKKQEAERARSFIEEQKSLSKNIEEDENF